MIARTDFAYRSDALGRVAVTVPAERPRDATALFLDIDSTLKGPKRDHYSADLIEAIGDFIDHGGRAVIVTGRSLAHAFEASLELGIIAHDHAHERPSFFVGDHGTLIGSTEPGASQAFSLRAGVAQDLTARAFDAGCIIDLSTPNGAVYRAMPPGMTAEKSLRITDRVEPDRAALLAESAAATLVQIRNAPPELAAYARTIPDVVVTEHHGRTDSWLMVAPVAAGEPVNKGTAVAVIEQRLGIDPQRAYAFGDRTDIDGPMGNHAHMVAVANADPALLDRAAYICDAYQNDGPAAMIRRLTPSIAA